MRFPRSDDTAPAPAGRFLVLATVAAWLPFICLFAPYKMTVQDGDAWYVSYSSLLYLRACWLYSPTVNLFGPAWLVAAGVVQSTLVMLGLRICIQRACRLIDRAPQFLARTRASLFERIGHARADEGAHQGQAAFFGESKRFYPKPLVTQ